MSLEYTTSDGETVEVPVCMDPFQQLEISPSATPSVTKRAVIRELANPQRQSRAMASLAYDMITSTCCRYEKKDTMYFITRPDIFFYATIGHKDKVLAEIAMDSSLTCSVDGNQRTVLYVAARSGYEDIVEALVQKGADVNHRQRDDSTPLHVASFYNQKNIVTMLLIYGADMTLKNIYGNTPLDEADSDVKKVFESFSSDSLKVTVTFFASTTTTKGIHPIVYDGKEIGAEVVRSMRETDLATQFQWSMIQQNWEVAYHGTKQKYVRSILAYGLLPSGAELPDGEQIKPPSNHFSLEMNYAGVQNWSKAIFVSPSILYASHPCYSERIQKGDSHWCVVVKVYINPSSYENYGSTVQIKDKPLDGEPSKPEYRVDKEAAEGEMSRMWKAMSRFYDSGESRKSFQKKTEASRNVAVASVLFIDTDFLDNVNEYGLCHEDLSKIFK